MIDRRKNSREFFVAGWDPYVIELTAESRTPTKDQTQPDPKPDTTRWRTMLLRRIGLSRPDSA